MTDPDLALPLPTLKRQSLGDQVAQTIRDLISTDRLKPSERILETELAVQLNVSRGPVRDALKQLAVEGLVTLAEKGGAYVAEPSPEEIRALVGLRYRMEEYVIELAMPRISAEGFAELRAIIAEMRGAAAADDMNRLQELDVHYHRTLWEWAGSKRLVDLLALAVSPLMLSRLWHSWRGDVISAHEKTLDAIAAGDLAAVRSRFARIAEISLAAL